MTKFAAAVAISLAIITSVLASAQAGIASSGAIRVAKATQIQKGMKLNSNVGLYRSLRDKNRQQIIDVARAEIQKALPDIELRFFRKVRVAKTSKYFRVTFESNMDIQFQNMPSRDLKIPGAISNARQNFVTFYSSEAGDRVEPTDSRQLYRFTDEMLKIAETFAVDDALTFEERQDIWLVGVSHPSRDGRPGGWEKYSIDKRTNERKMVEHEHPTDASVGQNLNGVGISGPKEMDPEIEITD